MLGNKIRGVIFDFDDTLVNTMGGIERARKAVFSHVKKDHSIDERTYEEAIKLTSAEFEKAKNLKKRNKYLFYELMSYKSGLRFSKEQIEKYADVFEKSLTNDIEFSVHLEEVVQKLKGAGIKLGILTGAALYPGAKKMRLEKLPVIKLFDAVVIATETIPEDKTGVTAFIKSAEMLGLPANEILFVGDRQDIDISNSKKAGMKAVLFNAYRKSSSGIDEYKADYIISDLKELLIILGIN